MITMPDSNWANLFHWALIQWF